MQRRLLALVIAGACLLGASSTRADELTATVPRGIFIFDQSFVTSHLTNRYGDDGEKTTLIEEVERYEPGGGLQGIITPNASARFYLLVTKIQYGLLDNLTLALGVPLVVKTTVDLELGWEEGDYQAPLGRAYSEDDFWEWAASMGQDKPGDWTGNRYTLSDIIVGGRYRFSDDIGWLRRNDLAMALQIMLTLPTGTPGDVEEIAAVGTTSREFFAQGEVAAHLGMETHLPGPLADRFSIGFDLFYEAMVEREMKAPTGAKHPLLLNYQPYVGDTYTIDQGDFSGAAILLEAVAYKGPFVSKRFLPEGKGPPLLKLSAELRYTHVAQSDWHSDSEIWDWEREKFWRPGHKRALTVRASSSLLRLGIPLQLYVAYRNMSWMGGKNVPAADVLTTGIQVPAKFW